MHISVMLHETVEGLLPGPGKTFIDGTLGGGGHTEELLRLSGPDGRVLGLDRDPSALARASERLAPFGARFSAVHTNFASMAEAAQTAGISAVDGVLLDLGVSSFQLDEAERGFSFQKDGPLDMRMDPTRGETAAELLARLLPDPHALARLLRDYGEEPQALRIARALAASKAPFTSTLQLAQAIEKALGGRCGAARHPASRAFQALRIAVNAELSAAQTGIEAALSLLAPGGRCAVISFHSLEDRIVKHLFAEHAGRMESLQQGGARRVGLNPAVRLITRHPILPSEEEIAANPRSRSAKLRIAERLAS